MILQEYRFHPVLIAAILFFAVTSIAHAQNESVYTKFDLEADCEFYDSNELGGSARCPGHENFPVYFSEGDLRQMVRFGNVPEEAPYWESFQEFNHVGGTIEWRVNNNVPYAAILRWFIENQDDETGEVTTANTGQVLVISTIGTPDNPVSCFAGFVDARANRNANAMARQVADDVAQTFTCGTDTPVFHGSKGPLSGSPTSMGQ